METTEEERQPPRKCCMASSWTFPPPPLLSEGTLGKGITGLSSIFDALCSMTLAWIAEGYVTVGSYLVKNSFLADSSPENSIQAQEAKPLRSHPTRLLSAAQLFQHARGTQCALLFGCRKKWLFAAAWKLQDREYRNTENIRMNVSKWI